MWLCCIGLAIQFNSIQFNSIQFNSIAMHHTTFTTLHCIRHTVVHKMNCSQTKYNINSSNFRRAMNLITNHQLQFELNKSKFIWEMLKHCYEYINLKFIIKSFDDLNIKEIDLVNTINYHF